MIIPIGDWVLRTACEQQRVWKEQGYGDFRMSVNVSPYQFHDEQLAERFLEIIAETGIEPGATRGWKLRNHWLFTM